MSWLPRLFRNVTRRPRRRAAATVLGFYAEAQLAGWVAAPEHFKAEQKKNTSAPCDTEGLLGRFYESQEC